MESVCIIAQYSLRFDSCNYDNFHFKKLLIYFAIIIISLSICLASLHAVCFSFVELNTLQYSTKCTMVKKMRKWEMSKTLLMESLLGG